MIYVFDNMQICQICQILQICFVFIYFQVMKLTNMQSNDPFQNIFGPVRIAIDKIRELELHGQMYGLSQYLPHSIIVLKNSELPMVVDLYIPGFTFYFQFLIAKNPKTNMIEIADFRVVYPQSYAKQIDSIHQKFKEKEGLNLDNLEEELEGLEDE